VRRLGFARENGARPGWVSRDGGAETYFRLQLHSKAQDPYSGGECTLKFQRSDSGRPGALSGSARFDQLLTPAELETVVEHQNAVIASLPPPPPAHLATYPANLRDTYLQWFKPQSKFRPGDLWLRFRTLNDIEDWLTLIRPLLPRVLERAKRLDPHVLYLASEIDLDATPLRPKTPVVLRHHPEESG
jgi:hypothetical protein